LGNDRKGEGNSLIEIAYKAYNATSHQKLQDSELEGAIRAEKNDDGAQFVLFVFIFHHLSNTEAIVLKYHHVTKHYECCVVTTW
jgi:hypothetical protein